MREVMTLSLGAHANFTNAHFWNFQDELAAVQSGGVAQEVDHEVLYRVGEVRGAEAYTPRMVVLDTKGSLGGLPQRGLLYDHQSSATAAAGSVAAGYGYSAQVAMAAVSQAGVWHAGIQGVVQQPVEPNSFMRGLSGADYELQSEIDAEQRELQERWSDEGEEGGDDDDDDDDDELGERAGQEMSHRAAGAAGLTQQQQHAPRPTSGASATIDDEAGRDSIAQELQESVRYWSDYLKSHVHPRSLHVLQRTTHFDSAGFNSFGAGTEAFRSDHAVEDAMDACRRFLEECDLLQGFHVLVDADSAWGGVAAEAVE
jgi:hypothetical protein